MQLQILTHESLNSTGATACDEEDKRSGFVLNLVWIVGLFSYALVCGLSFQISVLRIFLLLIRILMNAGSWHCQ